MLALLSVIICYSLLTFGAVLPNSQLLVVLLWVAFVGSFVIARIFTGRLHGRIIFILSASLVLLGAMPPRLSIIIVAAFVAWMSAATERYTDRLRFLNLLVVVGVLEAILGLFQFWVSPGWILGYINVNSQVSGTLINRNHFAGLLEMLTPASLGLAYISSRRYGEFARAYLYILAAAVMGVALFFSLSRMGIFAFLATVCLLGILMQCRHSRRGLAAVLIGGVLSLVIVGALWIGVDVIVERYSQLLGEEAVLREGRMLVFRDTLAMIAANPLGVGSGNFEDTFRAYQTYRPDLLFDHAHNDYLETAAEWGVPFAAMFWFFIILIVIRNIRLFMVINSPEARGILLAAVGAIFSMLVHSLADFNLQIPVNAMLFCVFLAISLSIRETPKQSGVRIQ